MNWLHFDISEFACKCQCGTNNMDVDFITRLDEMREFTGVKMIVTSGCRCVKYNAVVGGEPSSSHIATRTKIACAADIACHSPKERALLIEAAWQYGIRRIGVYPSFLHFDTDIEKYAPAIWLGK